MDNFNETSRRHHSLESIKTLMGYSPIVGEGAKRIPIYKLETTNAPTKATARVCHFWSTLNIPYSAEISDHVLAQTSAIVSSSIRVKIGQERKVPTCVYALGFICRLVVGVIFHGGAASNGSGPFVQHSVSGRSVRW
jgi:hypothetical protein